jgi:hypothetical protein
MSQLPQLDIIRVDPEITMTSSRTVTNTSTASINTYHITFSNPVEIENGEVHFQPNAMIRGKYYPFDFKGKHYLIRKTKDNVIDIFEIKDKR